MGVIALCETPLLIAVDTVAVPGADVYTTLTHGGPFGLVGALLAWIAYRGFPMVQKQQSETTALFMDILEKREKQHQEDRREIMQHDADRSDKLFTVLGQLATAHAAHAEAIAKLADAVDRIRPAKRKPDEGGPNAAAH
jgi:ERCC4-type nuclease